MNTDAHRYLSLVPMLLRGNAYPCMGYHGGVWEPVISIIDGNASTCYHFLGNVTLVEKSLGESECKKAR